MMRRWSGLDAGSCTVDRQAEIVTAATPTRKVRRRTDLATAGKVITVTDLSLPNSHGAHTVVQAVFRTIVINELEVGNIRNDLQRIVSISGASVQCGGLARGNPHRGDAVVPVVNTRCRILAATFMLTRAIGISQIRYVARNMRARSLEVRVLVDNDAGRQF
jgi:hypothetical protein